MTKTISGILIIYIVVLISTVKGQEVAETTPPLTKQERTYLREVIGFAIQELGCKQKQDGSSGDLPPMFYDDQVLKVKVAIHVTDIGSIRDRDMDFSIDYFLTQKWNVDSETCEKYRTRVNSVSPKATSEAINFTDTPYPIPPALMNLFWLPDTYVTNSKKVEMPSEVLTTKTMKVAKNDDSTCEIEYVGRYAAVISCQMNFQDYPVDTQRCPFKLRSYSLPSSIVTYEWLENVTVAPEVKLLQHQVSIEQTVDTKYTLQQKYSYLYVIFIFKREIANHAIQVFAPSLLLLIPTWFTFWLGTNDMPERITICITSLLALVTQFASVGQELPPISYVNAIDIWMIVCMLYVVSSTVECLIVNSLHRKHQRMLWQAAATKARLEKSKLAVTRMSLSSRPNLQRPPMAIASIVSKLTQSRKAKWKEVQYNPDSPRWKKWLYRFLFSEDDATNVDRMSRILFPASFAVFGTVYWINLLSKRQGN